MAKENNALAEAIETIRHIWIHRKSNTIPAAVFDTIDALYGRENMKPLIIKTNKLKTESGYHFVINLPPGVSYREFAKKEHYFADSTGGAVQIEKQGKAVYLTVMTDELKKSYPYTWDYAPYDKMHLPVPFGYSALGPIVRDLADAPNLIIAGHPGAGKTAFIHTLAVSLLLAREICLIIIDLKVLEFDYLSGHGLVITELEKVKVVLTAINKQLDMRLQVLRRAGCVKLIDYRGDDMPFIVLIIDELAEMQDEECQEMLNRILRLGRAAGICVVAATQRPSSTLFKKFGDSKAMFAATMCFHVRDEVNSRMLLDNDRAALIPGNVPGRAIFQWDKELEVQTMYLPVPGEATNIIRHLERREVKWVDQPRKMLPPR